MAVITLSTDIGQSDFIIGAIKGQLISAISSASIIDITHQLSPQNYQQAAYVCSNAFSYYPEGTFHILLINFFEHSFNHVLIVEYGNHYIICPDNGILTMIAGKKPETVFALDIDDSINKGLLTYTNSISVLIKNMSDGKTIESLCRQATSIQEKYSLRATTSTNWIDSHIIFVDNFENVVVNIKKEEFEEHRKGRKYKITFMRNEVIDKISDNYAMVEQGGKLAWFNSAGYLEIAVNTGNLAGLFGLYKFSESAASNNALQHKLMYQMVRIYFE